MTRLSGCRARLGLLQHRPGPTSETGFGYARLLPLRALPLLLILAVMPLNARVDPFDLGVELTREGRFDEALTRFLDARREGDQSAHLDFNLGVVQYRLGQYDAARVSFDRASRDPQMADLARYNLGLVERAAGHPVAAKGWFEYTADHAGDPGLRSLARSALEMDRATAPPAPPSVQGGLQVLRGRDSNVVVPVGAIADAPTSTEDEYWDLRAGLQGTLDRWITGLGYHLNTLWLSYDALDDADIGAAEIGVDWRGALSVELNASVLTVGDHGYQRSLDLQTRAPLWQGRLGTLELSAQAARLDALDLRAEPLSGYQYGAGLAHRLGTGALRLHTQYLHLENNRDDPALSPSQDRFDLSGLGRWSRWSLRLWARVINSRYEASRTDRVQDLGASLAYALHACCEILVEFARQENDSTATPFSYVSHRSSAGIRLQF